MLRVLDRHAVGQILRTKDVDAWGVAANDPRLPLAPHHPTAISLLMRLDPLVVRTLPHGPSPEYRREYLRLNAALDDATATLAGVLRAHGHTAEPVPATTEADSDDMPFPHKTAATAAGLGWIGKTALFVSPTFGPAVRLATVFTDLCLPPGEPVTESRCGDCRACIDACPANCGRDVLWEAGMPREQLFDAAACLRYMRSISTDHMDICGLCIAACPYSQHH